MVRGFGVRARQGMSPVASYDAHLRFFGRIRLESVRIQMESVVAKIKASKHVADGAKSAPLQLFVDTSGNSKNTVSVKFGAVSVRVSLPTDEVVRSGVRASAKAVDRLSKRLVQPGVSIKREKDVPTYTANPRNPTQVVRHLNGQSEVGEFVRGKFKVLHG